MDNWILYSLIGGGLLAIAILLFVFRKKRPLDLITRVYVIKNKIIQPAGWTLWVEDIATITPPEIAAIERGIRERLTFIQSLGYVKRPDYDGDPFDIKRYTVAIVGDCVKSPAGNWAYKLPVAGTGYEGTKWDYGGYILAAGQEISPDPPIIVIPEHHGEDLAELSTVSGYEIEHCVAYACDLELYLRTAVHTAEHGHPIFPVT